MSFPLAALDASRDYIKLQDISAINATENSTTITQRPQITYLIATKGRYEPSPIVTNLSSAEVHTRKEEIVQLTCPCNHIYSLTHSVLALAMD